MICAFGALLAVQANILDLDESSGLAVTDEVLWTLEDSSGPTTLYAVSLDGELLGTSDIPGATNRDWEALSAGPCPDDHARRCLFIGDIGDNTRSRNEVRIIVVRVPVPGQPAEVVDTWHLRYPDKAHNAETLLVDPQGVARIVTKSHKGHSKVFRVPVGGGLLTLDGELNVPSWPGDLNPKLTGGDQRGDTVVLRTYADVWLWDGDVARWWTRPPDRRVDMKRLVQAEAIAILPDGSLLTTSEGEPMEMRRLECAK